MNDSIINSKNNERDHLSFDLKKNLYIYNTYITLLPFYLYSHSFIKCTLVYLEPYQCQSLSIGAQL